MGFIQFTPPGSQCSIIFGKAVTTAQPGTAQGLHLIVSDIKAACAELAKRGVEVSEIFHDAGGVFHHGGPEGRVSGSASDRQSYGSFASFSDPDGNGWLFQEVTARLPGRVEGNTRFGSVSELTSALRRAEAAHGEHEQRSGKRDENWPAWYAEYIVNEQAGKPLPT
jgi:hypothetical protein